MKQYLTEVKRLQKLAGIKPSSSIIIEAVEVPNWLNKKLEDVHTKPGQGSIFAKSIEDVLKIAQSALDQEKDIDKIANGTGTLTVDSPGIGYNLVLPIEQAKKLAGAKESEVEKIEGPNKIKVPAITTSAPLSQFKSNQLTIIVRPKKDAEGKVIPNEYIVLSAFPGDPSIPRASEWGGKYAVIIPNTEENTKIKENRLKEVLDQLTDSKTSSDWIKSQLDTYIDNNLSDYGAGYYVQEKLEKLLKLICKKFNISEKSFKVDNDSNISSNEYDETFVKGEITLNDNKIIEYSSHGDGYGFTAKVDNEAIKNELDKFIKKSVNESLNQQKEDKLSGLFYDEAQKFTGVFGYSTCSDDDWDRVKDYIKKEKDTFLNNNSDVSQEEFDEYYDKFIDYIEDERSLESRNQQDLNWN